MIKRVIGVVFTILVFVVILLAATNWGSYRSLVFNFGSQPEQVFVEPDFEVEHRAVEQADSVVQKAKKSVKKSTKKQRPKQMQAKQTSDPERKSVKKSTKKAVTKKATAKTSAEQSAN